MWQGSSVTKYFKGASEKSEIFKIYALKGRLWNKCFWAGETPGLKKVQEGEIFFTPNGDEEQLFLKLSLFSS